MGGLSDVLKFETFNFKKMGKQIAHDPWRVFIGSGDRYTTSMWNKILGRHDDPVVDQFGGAASQRYGEAEDAGIDTTAGRNMHTIARLIALYNAGGSGAPEEPGAPPAVPPAAPGSSGASGAGLSAMNLFQQQGSQSDEPQHRAEIYQQDPYLQSLMTSSKRAKTAAKGGAREAMDRGMSGDNPIDANGVQVLQIQQLTKQVAKLTKLVTQIERERARKG